MPEQSPIVLAEQLLQLATSVYGPGDEKDAQITYDIKHRMIALCDELKQHIMGPAEYTILLAESCQESSALRFVSELGVPDIIADETQSLSEISEKTGIDTRYLHITMNCLLSHGYFEEVGGFGSQQFRNNTMSNALRSDRDESIKEAIGFICDDGFKSAAYLLEAASRSMKGVSDSKELTSGAKVAFGFPGSIFEWMASPEQSYRGKRMGKAMQQLHRMANRNVITDFAWCELSSPIVDIGGGIGSLEMGLFKVHPAIPLKFVIFDIPETIQNAEKLWSAVLPDDAQTRVSFVAGDFLATSTEKTNIPTGQPTYLIRHVLHDWTDEDVIVILKNVRAAMISGQGTANASKLLVCETLLRETSSRFVHTTSMQILALNNGMTRMEKHMTRLISEAGFTDIKVHAMRSVDSIIEAVPA